MIIDYSRGDQLLWTFDRPMSLLDYEINLIKNIYISFV